MTPDPADAIRFGRLTDVPLPVLVAQMNDPRLAAHLPLLTGVWDEAEAARFVAAKEACWQRDGLGHWAIHNDGAYVGWGGFQKEGAEWDFGLVLTSQAWGLGRRILGRALALATADPRIPFVTFLLPRSRSNLSALRRFGAVEIAPVTHEGTVFRKFRLDTPMPAALRRTLAPGHANS